MNLTLSALLKLLAAGGVEGVAHLVGNPGLIVADDAVELWDAVVASIQANQALEQLLDTLVK